ncbi:DNA-directed RNA polymerase subunit omega [Hippea maritima]|uniref:DNA-directed RNA polymerase subunit omega n=1 Tax=Hippea maritima (strain ATCC 700847 / DSM 10411 / MH2) TaxID=760142 RepID=F2LUB4_HIPMA|nr:DNA-directed RNA polymerase subunit omega [Hippea maritima]AEA33440.1 RNA polymerase Rpb6 [Hippea maritima DSM 10411]
MEIFIPEIINGALRHFPSRYELVRVAAIRANSLFRGDKPLISNSFASAHKNTIVSLMEIKEGLWKKK